MGLTALPTGITALTSLDVLNASANAISTLPVLSTLLDLDILNLSANTLTGLSNQFNGLTNLQVLDLSTNTISTIANSTFA
jgi:Leucine-rich repeat (LRR) protein